MMMAINSKWLAQETKMKGISIFDDLQFMLLTFSLFFCPFILSRPFFLDGKINEWCNQNQYRFRIQIGAIVVEYVW